MQAAGENYARLRMCPWAFGIETAPNLLTRYSLDQAWRLDYVFQLAEQRGIFLMLCPVYIGQGTLLLADLDAETKPGAFFRARSNH